MTSAKRDLLIHYDEESGELVFYPARMEATAEIRASSFDGARSEISFFQEMTPEEAERSLGGLVFSLIDLNSEKKIGIRDYCSEAEVAHTKYVEALEEDAKTGDAEAQHHLSMAMHESAMKNCSLSDLERAESLLMAAIAQGHPAAIERLKTWPQLKSATEKRIARGKSQ